MTDPSEMYQRRDGEKNEKGHKKGTLSEIHSLLQKLVRMFLISNGLYYGKDAEDMDNMFRKLIEEYETWWVTINIKKRNSSEK